MDAHRAERCNPLARRGGERALVCLRQACGNFDAGKASRHPDILANNIVHDNGGRGVYLYRSEHVDVVNNTAWNNMLSSSTYIQSGEIDALDSSDVNVINNVAVNLVGKDVTYDDGNHYDYNLWDGARVPFKWGHDIAGKANLTDPGGGNFAPRAGSPALRSGTNVLAPADDFLGNSRPAGAIDRGAIQVSQ
ncbi:MAG: hypothetical protein AUH83_07995 [Deltaproteobacteria bacterium 13_1_40CM_4_68_19]|nr:MAG: hypothetical protein AUH83_07995 [Deltaproteobacteria bacterium 13_1_40CM_4_68_19]